MNNENETTENEASATHGESAFTNLLDCDDKEYGVHKMQYGDMTPVDAISIGDGSVLMLGIVKDDTGFASVGFACGEGDGVVGVEKPEMSGKLLCDDMKVDFLLRFDNPLSVDVLIEKLVDCKRYLLED